MTAQITKAELLKFIRTHWLAVQSSVSVTGGPQSAVVGFVASDEFHIFFDTLEDSRKANNLRQNPRISFVIGGLLAGDERTVQYEGTADEPEGEELEALKELYFKRFPGERVRESAGGVKFLRAKPAWIRYSDYNQAPPEIVEFVFGEHAPGG